MFPEIAGTKVQLIAKKKKGITFYRSIDLSKEYGRILKTESYIPQAGVAVRQSFADANPEFILVLHKTMKKSSKALLANPKRVIKVTNTVWKGQGKIEKFYNILYKLKPALVAGKMRGFPATLQKISTITPPMMKRSDKMIQSLIQSITNTIHNSNKPKFTKCAFVKTEKNISMFTETMIHKNWKIIHIKSNTKTDFEERPDLIIIDGKHKKTKYLLDMYGNQVTRFLFINNIPKEGLLNLDNDSLQQNLSTHISLVNWWGYDNIYADLISKVKNIKTTNISIGHNWTYIQTKYSSGLCRSPDRATEGARTLAKAGDLKKLSLKELAKLALEDDDLCRSVGISAINAHYNTTAKGYTDQQQWGFRLFREAIGNKVCIGNFPQVTKILPDIKVIEREPNKQQYSVAQGENIIPECRHVIITAQTLMNGSLPRILFLAQGADIMLLGPSTPLSNVWKKYGVRWACGIVPTNQEKMLDFISQAGAMLVLEDRTQKITLGF